MKSKEEIEDALIGLDAMRKMAAGLDDDDRLHTIQVAIFALNWAIDGKESPCTEFLNGSQVLGRIDKSMGATLASIQKMTAKLNTEAPCTTASSTDT